jgi:hypothetical protein
MLKTRMSRIALICAVVYGGFLLATYILNGWSGFLGLLILYAALGLLFLFIGKVIIPWVERGDST